MYICIEKKYSIYRVRYYLLFQASTGELGMYPWGRETIIIGIFQRGTQVERPEKDESVLSMKMV